MKIIEQFIDGKVNIDTCEDNLIITDDFIAVIDGVSSKSDYRKGGKTTGKLASEIIGEVIENLPLDSTIEQVIESINTEIQKFYVSNVFPYDKASLGLQAMMALYSQYHQQVYLICDCQVVVDGKTYLNPKLSDTTLEHFRSLIAHIEVTTSGQDFNEYFSNGDQARERILPWITQSTIFANDDTTPWGYSVLNGDTVPASLIKVIDVPENSQVILASDGYPFVEGSLEVSEMKLTSLLADDPFLINIVKSTKGVTNGASSFDDRTYIRFTI
ncbi:hypothetical protein HZY88_09925 [Aerococcaceae bacterium DSM 111176]|nr:hypothetical protein [Aerococcaceae bacterium DSM 111176]